MFLLSVNNPAGERFKRSEEICDFALSCSVGESPDVNDVLVLAILIKTGLIITILRNIKKLLKFGLYLSLTLSGLEV